MTLADIRKRIATAKRKRRLRRAKAYLARNA